MDNLYLPNLIELHLHRNKITKISDLNGCPKLKKLRLFQNKITSIANLHSLPELEDLWLQQNSIKSLSGLENNKKLIFLGLAGNQIDDFRELKKLTMLTKLKEVSFNDIHFGFYFILFNKLVYQVIILFLCFFIFYISVFLI
jgi:Leucine-rich repeat (LRR) protein